MLKNLKKVAAIVLSFAMAVQFGLADSYYVNAVEEPVEPQQQEETTTTTPQEQEQVPTTEEETPQQQEEDTPAAEETNEQSAPETKSVELSYVAEDGTVLHETASRDFNLDYSLKTDSSVMLNFDGYTLKDVIINNSQTVPADQANLSVTSELVSVKFVYVSVNTKEDKQTSENNEQTKTEEANEDDAEADPETKEELPEYPAFDQSETAGNVVVHATATEGVLPRDSKLVVKRITRKAILNAVEDTVSEKNKEMDSAVALDITIQNKDGVEIQPNGSVNISFENAAVSGDEINIYHVTDDASAVTEVATNTQSFDANHFSIYVITGVNDVQLTTFNFVANGTTVSTQIVKTGDTLITPTAPDVAGKAFVEWQENGTKFDGFGVQKITKTETRTITAKYVDALYVYFLKPDGSQIMRTEKVEDHKDHDYSHVSYDVDATHKLVGWAKKQNGTDDITKNIAVPEGSTSVNVYAIIQEGHWVTFDSDGGSAIDSQFVLDGNELTLNKSTTPTKPGYEFVGWYDGLTKVEDGSAVTNPMTLKAHWKAKEVSYTINYWQQKVTDDKNATDAQKTYEYVSAETKKATTGTTISASNTKSYNGFTYNANNSSKDVEIAGDGTTIINVYYDRVLCTVNFYEVTSRGLTKEKTATGLYEASLPKDTWDTSTYAWYSSYNHRWGWGYSVAGSGCILLTSFDFKTAGYENNTDNKKSNGIVTECNFYGTKASREYEVRYYNQQADGSYKLVQTVNTSGGTLTVHEKFIGYDLYKLVKGNVNGESSGYWDRNGSNVKDGYQCEYNNSGIINIASKLKTYSLYYYNYNGVAKTVENIKYTASLESYANYTPEKPSGLPEYYEFGGWYKDKTCTTKFDFSKETMPNANLQIYAKWTAKKIKLTYNLNTPDGTSMTVNRDVDAGTIASTVLPSATPTSDYSFAGWYYADSNGNITKHAFNANEAITKGTSVIGKWLYNGELTVKYVADGVEVPEDNNVYAGGAKATVASGVTKEGKKFLGWQLDGNVYQPGQDFEVNKYLADDRNVITLTAVFGDSETSAILNYHPGNGDGKDQSVAILNNVEVTLKNTSDLSYTAPGKDYYFAGWATSMEDAQKGNAKYAVGDKVRVNADSSNDLSNDLYATWVEKTVINVTANSNTLPYNGEEQKVEGFQDVVGGYTVTGLTAVATGKDAGTYETKITGTAIVTKGDVDVTDKVIVNVTKGKLTVSKRNVTLTSGSDSKIYNGKPLTNGEVTVTGDGFANGEGATYDVTGTITNVGEKANAFTYKLNKGTNAGNYVITKAEGTLKVTPKSIVPDGPNTPDEKKTGITATDPEDSIYDGKAHVNALTVRDTKTGKNLVENKDYTLTYSDDVTNVGTVKVTVKGKGNYTGEFTKKYQITPREYTVTTDSANKTYDGTALTAGGHVNGLAEGETVIFKTTGSQINEGTSDNTYELKFEGTAVETNYKHGIDSIGTLTVKAQSIVPDPEHPETYLGIEIDSPSDITYDGKEHKWIPTVTDNADKKLEVDTDYTVEYSTENFKDVGTIDVTITGIGNYTGTVKRSYKVTPKEYTVTTDSATKTYSGTALTAGGKVEGIVSGETVEFTTTGSQTEVGTSKNTYELVWKSAKATNYTLAKESIGKLTVKTKSIVPDDKDTPESDKTGITVNEPSDSKYDGKVHREVLTVTDTKTGKELVAGTDYSVTYSSDLVNAGTVKVTVAGLGNYTGSFTKTYKITKRSVTLTSATVSKVYDGSALTNTDIAVSGDGFVEGEGASYEVTGTQTEVGNSANAFEYKLNEKTLASNYNITKVVGTLTITAAPAPVTPATPSTPSTPSSTTSTTPRTLSAPQVTTPVETVEKETTPKAEPKKEEKVEEEYTPKASPQYYWALINLICAILTVLFGLLLLISKRHKSEDDDEEDDETKQQTTNDDEEKEQEKKRGLFTRVLAVLIAIVSVVFFLVTEDLSLPWTWTDQWTIWMVVIGLVQIVVFFVGRKWKNVDNDDEDEEAQQA